MMKKIPAAVLLGFFILANLSAEPVGKTSKAVRIAADPILNNIIDGMKTGDVQKFRRDFDDTMKDIFPDEKSAETIKQINDQIGNYKSREYLGFLNAQGMTKVLWKGRYDKTDADVLITVVISKRNNKYLVTGLWFQ